MKFGFVYTHDGLVVYDVCQGRINGQDVWVASLSSDPRRHVVAASREAAVAQLLEQLGLASQGRMSLRVTRFEQA